MRVAVVSESFLPTVNGVTTSVRHVLEHLRDRGHEAIVIAPSAGAPRTYAGFPVHEVPALPYRQFPVGLPSPQVQRLLADFQPDVLHAASPFALGAAALTAAKKLGVGTVAVYQTDVAGYARRNGLAAASGIAWKIVRRIHADADVTLAPSSASVADLLHAGVQRVARWGRGVDLDRYHPRNRALDESRELRAQLAGPDEVLVGYVGRVAPEKRLQRLAALRGIRNARFVVVGSGPAMPTVTRALDGMPVRYLGALHGERLAAAYAALDVFVHPGTEETFGQTLQESFASGVPVVAPRAGGPIDLVDHGVNGFLVDPEDDRPLRDAVSTLVANGPLRARMGEAGRRSVLGRTWAGVCDDLLGHYEHVATRAGVSTSR